MNRRLRLPPQTAWFRANAPRLFDSRSTEARGLALARYDAAFAHWQRSRPIDEIEARFARMLRR